MTTNQHPLTEAELAHYREHGYVAVENFFPADELQALDDHLARFAAGKEAAVQKATYPSIVGLAKSRKIAADLTTKAYDALKPLKGKAVALEALADYLLKRDH